MKYVRLSLLERLRFGLKPRHITVYTSPAPEPGRPTLRHCRPAAEEASTSRLKDHQISDHLFAKRTNDLVECLLAQRIPPAADVAIYGQVDGKSLRRVKHGQHCEVRKRERAATHIRDAGKSTIAGRQKTLEKASARCQRIEVRFLGGKFDAGGILENPGARGADMNRCEVHPLVDLCPRLSVLGIQAGVVLFRQVPNDRPVRMLPDRVDVTVIASEAAEACT